MPDTVSQPWSGLSAYLDNSDYPVGGTSCLLAPVPWPVPQCTSRAAGKPRLQLPFALCPPREMLLRLVLLLRWLALSTAAAALSEASAPLQCPTAAGVARGAQQLCGAAPVCDVLRSVGLACTREKTYAGDAARAGVGAGIPPPPPPPPPPPSSPLPLLLEEHGFQTALDLRLLDADGQEAAELMEQLRLGGVGIGERSKVRLLLLGTRDRDII
eukprot:SAG31_NODE_7017_length_1816_cov_1.220151_2_plen_214_part_00